MDKKDKFFWGASTASHQVEGNTYNQWTVWELENAKQLAKNSKKTYDWMPNYENIKEQASDPNNYVSGSGVDHYNRYKEDFDILKSLNLNSFRFGIEWSRIEPEKGVFDKKEIEHYKEYISELKKRDIEPFLNIWHWTMPVWFTNMGGFEKRRNIKYFLRYVQKISEELLDGVNYAITINEANSYFMMSYITPKWPPAKKQPIKGLAVQYNLSIAHKKAYKIIKHANPNISVGLAHQATLNLPKNKDNILEKLSAKMANYLWHGWFFNRAKKHQDFLGFNYYFTNYMKGPAIDNPKKPINDLGWYMEPYSIKKLLVDLSNKYKKPVIITENGLADADDKNRKWWISETMRAMDDAIEEGADIKGYFHWSLLDNFEWSDGWWPKFGLVEVDRKNGMKRTVRPSAKWWAEELIKRNN